MIKFGLRKISLSYSKISLADICSRLHMDSIIETEYIVAKAIRDGVIDASINHEEGYLQTMVIQELRCRKYQTFTQQMNHKMFSIDE